MKIKMQKGDNESQISFPGAEITITGNSLDDRGEAAIKFLREKTQLLISMEYNSNELKLNIENNSIDVDDTDEYFKKFANKTVVLETSTLGFTEIFLCCKALKNLGASKLTLLYVEPLRYYTPRRSELLHRRDFEISQEFTGFRAIPGATFMFSDERNYRGVFFLGYEERRLDCALEECQMIQPSLCSIVFGVPAFQPGWEMDAFANNIRIIEDKRIKGGIYFCGADNPASVVSKLTEFHESLDSSEQMFVSPIGTKPNGIGVALFVSCYPDVGILYDHPKRAKDRSEQIGKWHLFEVEF